MGSRAPPAMNSSMSANFSLSWRNFRSRSKTSFSIFAILSSSSFSFSRDISLKLLTLEHFLIKRPFSLVSSFDLNHSDRRSLYAVVSKTLGGGSLRKPDLYRGLGQIADTSAWPALVKTRPWTFIGRIFLN